MFAALDKLLALHNAMLLESRLIKAFFIYSLSIFVLYMFTSTKRTYTVRPRLYIGTHTVLLWNIELQKHILVHRTYIDFLYVIFFTGLCLTLLVEVAILRLTGNDIQQQTWKINLLRSLFAATSLVQLMHAIFTYRYEIKWQQLWHYI